MHDTLSKVGLRHKYVTNSNISTHKKGQLNEKPEKECTYINLLIYTQTNVYRGTQSYKYILDDLI